jgi:hypothetical protein
MWNHWLFFRDVMSHWVAAMSSIVSFTLGIVEYLRNRKTEGWIFAAIACLFLFVAFDQAWQDEHRNSIVLIGEKRASVSDAAFWKDQSYAKDEELRVRDDLLEKNYTALIGEQKTANESQSSLARLSGKILDIGKPVSLSVVTQALMEPPGDGPIKVRYFISLTNKPVNPAIMSVSCDQDIVAGEGAVVGAEQEMMGIGPIISKRRFTVSVGSPPWTPVSPILIDVHYTGARPDCGVEGVAQ